MKPATMAAALTASAQLIESLRLERDAAHAECAELRERIARDIEAAPILSWTHTDECPGRPGYRGICNCPKVPLIDRDRAARIARGAR